MNPEWEEGLNNLGKKPNGCLALLYLDRAYLK
jgi:hypothetical protein